MTKADADLNRLLATVAEEQATAERLNRTLEQALFTAQSRVHAVSEYIDTRRGSIGPEARTRLAEASRQLKPRRTNGRPTSAKRSHMPIPRRHWPLRLSHWPTTMSSPPSSPTPGVTAAATTWAR